MTTVPTGIFAQPYFLKLLVAASTTFQSVVSAADATAALEHIQYPDVEEIDGQGNVIHSRFPPRVVINDEVDFRREKFGTALWSTRGSLRLMFEFFIPPAVAAEGSENAAAWFMTKVGAIMAEMEALAGTGEPVSGHTHLNMVGYSRIVGPFEVQVTERHLPDPDANEHPQRLWTVIFLVSFF